MTRCKLDSPNHLHGNHLRLEPPQETRKMGRAYYKSLLSNDLMAILKAEITLKSSVFQGKMRYQNEMQITIT